MSSDRKHVKLDKGGKLKNVLKVVRKTEVSKWSKTSLKTKHGLYLTLLDAMPSSTI